MKVLSIVVPCYNSEEYMSKCIDSLLIDSNLIEILIINDGSTDNTQQIAEKYQSNHPDIVRVFSQENKGHGGAVNTGIQNASGYYLKVVDSDDCLNQPTLRKILNILNASINNNDPIDMFISNFMYDKQGAKHKRVINYHNIFPEDRVFQWTDVKSVVKWKYLMMHAVTFRRSLLIDCKLKLPEHTFYVDNIFLYKPLMYTEKMYYINDVLYNYYIGREGQSVNEALMIKRLDQQIKINKLLVDLFVEFQQTKRFQLKSLRKSLFNYLELITITTITIALLSDNVTAFKTNKEIWQYIYNSNKTLYRKLRVGICAGMNLPGKFGRNVSKSLYKITQKVIGFN